MKIVSLQLFSLMQEMGLEPTHCCQRQILSLMRLPFRHSCILLFSGESPKQEIFYHTHKKNARKKYKKQKENTKGLSIILDESYHI